MGSDFIVHVPAHEELSQKKGPSRGPLYSPEITWRAKTLLSRRRDHFSTVSSLRGYHLLFRWFHRCVGSHRPSPDELYAYLCSVRIPERATLRPLIRRTLPLASGPSHQALTINKDVQEHAAGRKCFSTAATALEALHAVGGMTARASKYCALML